MVSKQRALELGISNNTGAGVSATAEIRRIESARLQVDHDSRATRILALTGMSGLEDKRRAFDAGVDG